MFVCSVYWALVSLFRMATLVQKTSGSGTQGRDMEDDVFDSVDLLKHTRLLSLKDDGLFEGLETWLHGCVSSEAPVTATDDGMKSALAGATSPNTEMLLSLMSDESKSGVAAAGTSSPGQQPQVPLTDENLFELYAKILNDISTSATNKERGNADTEAFRLPLASLSAYLMGSDLELLPSDQNQPEAQSQADAKQLETTHEKTSVPRSRKSAPDKQAVMPQATTPSSSAPSDLTTLSNTAFQPDETDAAQFMQQQVERMMQRQQQQQQQQQMQQQQIQQQQQQMQHWPQFDPVAGGYPTSLPGYPPPLHKPMPPYSTVGPQYPPYGMPGMAESMYAMSQRAAQAPAPHSYSRYPPAAYLPQAAAMPGMMPRRPNPYSNPAAAHHAAVMVRAAAMMSSPHYYPIRPQMYGNYPGAPPPQAAAPAPARVPASAPYNAALGEHFQRIHTSPRRTPPILSRANSLKSTAGKRIAPSIKRTSSQKSVASYYVSSTSTSDAIQPLSTSQSSSTTFYVPPEPEPAQPVASPKPTSRHKKIPKATKKFMMNLRH